MQNLRRRPLLVRGVNRLRAHSAESPALRCASRAHSLGCRGVMRREENSTGTSLYAPWTASIISPLSLARETGFPSGVRVLSLSTPSPTVIRLSSVTWAALQARLGENREIEIERQNLGDFLRHSLLHRRPFPSPLDGG